jgi:hypothetical protein
MNHEADLIRHGMRTPRAAAIAGILFSFDVDLYHLATNADPPRWMAFLGFVRALTRLLSNGTIDGVLMVFHFGCS